MLFQQFQRGLYANKASEVCFSIGNWHIDVHTWTCQQPIRLQPLRSKNTRCSMSTWDCDYLNSNPDILSISFFHSRFPISPTMLCPSLSFFPLSLSVWKVSIPICCTVIFFWQTSAIWSQLNRSAVTVFFSIALSWLLYKDTLWSGVDNVLKNCTLIKVQSYLN